MDAGVGLASERWIRKLGPRFEAYWLSKHVLISVLMTAFFAGYFTLQSHPVFSVTTMPITWLDRAIGFHPLTLIFYASLWFYVPMVPMFIGDRRELVGYALSVIGLGLLGLSFFLFWPTSTPVPDVDWAKFPAFTFLKSIDKAGNACPSLHVTFALFSGVMADRVFRHVGAGLLTRTINWLWCIAIIYSTIATRQHVALDVFAGLALGSAWSLLHLKWVPEGSAIPVVVPPIPMADKIA